MSDLTLRRVGPTGALGLSLVLASASAFAQTPAEPPATPASTEEGAPRPARPPVPTVALSEEAEARLGTAPGEAATPAAEERVQRTLIPPVLLLERTPTRRTEVVFPVFFRERRLDSSVLLIPPYYRARSRTDRADVAFPLWFHWRGQRAEGGSYATRVVPPFYLHSWQGAGQARGTSVGLAPLFFYGETWGQDGALRREHLVIPPLLTYHTWTPEHALTIAGPFYYDRLRADTDWGVAPLVFGGSNLRRRYLLIPPLLTYHRYNREESTSLTVAGPFWTRSGPSSFGINLAPLFFHHHDATSTRTTVLPLFHYQHDATSTTLVTPLFGYHRDGDARTLITPLYQQHRGGTTDWDAVAPFLYLSREPSTGARTQAFFPLFYRRTTLSTNTLWIAPTAHYHRDAGDWYFNIYPLVYTGRTGRRTHNVVAPLFWDFHNEETGSRATVVAPLFWRFSDPNSVTMLAGNFLWMSAIRQGVRSYEWHVLPVFSYARPRPEDVSWNVLFGLAGYRRAGTHRQIRVFWIPINI